ncbi:MAG: deoxyribodipyrimidine photo-lyase [Helicobacteraceae bacterium]|nr:deoxyribodipyrimidine photo-lyase [Helicobacteraceae bacterium]
MRRILWFRRDLRIEDNPLLSYEGEVLPLFIFDTNILDSLDAEDKRVSYIFKAVLELKEKLRTLGLDLKLFYGDPLDVIDHLLQEYAFDEVVASGDYDSYAKERDKAISHKLHFRYIQDTYILKPSDVLKEDGSPYLVFTPFYKKARLALESKDLSPYGLAKQGLLASSYETMSTIQKDAAVSQREITLENLGFRPQEILLDDPRKRLSDFLKKIELYAQKRDYLQEDAGSSLSVALRFGRIGIREVLRAALLHPKSEAFVRQLLFRDFYALMLFYFPQIQTQNYKYAFNGIEDREKFERFCRAQTGVPIVDAAIQELLSFGTMHNRARMVVASFFTKDLLLPWQWGEAFFAKHLLDYDAASNILSWQWSAGTGVDPQPYFRIFNPYLQSKKFDKEGVYIKRYLPQLQNIEAKYLHDESFLQATEIPNYPKPIVSHKEAAKQAIELFKQGM